MHRLIGIVLIVGVIIISAVFAPQPVQADSLQQGSTWSAAIAYFNPTDSAGELTVSYYPEGGSGFTPTQLNVNGYYSGTILVGATPGTEGSAVLSSNFPMPAVYKIAGTSGNPYGIIMLEFFTSDQVGTSFYLPLVRKAAGGLTSRIGIQNIENAPVDVTLTFLTTGGATAFTTTLQDIPSQASEVFRTTDDAFSGLASGFEGSLIISATLDGTTTGADVVAASADINAAGDVMHSYQGAAAGATRTFVPAAFCSFGRTQQSTQLHVQNASGGNINANTITITYYDAAGATVATYSTHPALINGQRTTIDVCSAANVSGKALSAVITHSAAAVATVIETTNNQGLSAASISYGNYCPTTPCQLALPYVEWSSSAWDFETTVYIMNTGNGPTDVSVAYYRRDGTGETQQFTSLPANAMVETNPTQVAGLMNMSYRDFKGAILLESSTQPVMALVLVTKRFQNPDGSILGRGDSYMGILFTP